MKRRKWILPVSIVGGVIALCIVAVLIFGAVLSAKGFGISTGRLYFADNGTYLIDSDDMAMRVSDCSGDGDLFEGYQNGDEVILFHSGVEEVYPAQTGGHFMIRTAKGDGTYKPADEILGIYRGYLGDGVVDPGNAMSVGFSVKNVRTGLLEYSGDFPSVSVIHSVDELTAYYEENKEQFYLERREDPASDSTIGFLDACDKYNAEFFEEHALVFVILEEGSGSTRHNVEYVKIDANGIMYINIVSVDPEVGTCDMAYWHLMVAVDKEYVPESPEDVRVYYNDGLMCGDDAHAHGPANEAETVDDPVSGYCGNTFTTVKFEDGKSHNFMGSESVKLTDVVINLEYDPNKLCKCRPEYTVITESGKEYGVHLHGEGYARCEEGQAELTEEQIKTVTQIIEWAKEYAE